MKLFKIHLLTETTAPNAGITHKYAGAKTYGEVEKAYPEALKIEIVTKHLKLL